jgi:hypothetical protein
MPTLPTQLTYSAKRLSLMDYEISCDQGLLASINFSNWLWPTEGAPLSSVVDEALAAYPHIKADGKDYTAHRRLLTNNFLFNDYKIWLVDGNGKETISANIVAKEAAITIEYNNKTYFLKRHSIFSFHFTLEDNSQKASFREVTKFLTLSSKKDFQIDSVESIDAVLLGFSFFLATSSFYK